MASGTEVPCGSIRTRRSPVHRGRSAGRGPRRLFSGSIRGPLPPDGAAGAYRYPAVVSGGGVRGVGEGVFVRTPDGWKIVVTTACPAPDAPPPPRAIVGATLIDGSGAAPVRDAVVVTRNGRIACAGPRSGCPVPADADTVRAGGKWIVPGLIDT